MNSGNEIKEIKKEIIEARGLIIKSNNLTNSLAADVRSIAKRQTSYERHLAWNSIVAYIIFVVLIFGLVQFVYSQRHASLEDEVAIAKQRVAEQQKKIDEYKNQHRTDNKNQNEGLMVLYDLVHEREKQAAIDAYEALELDTLTPLEAKLLKDAVEGFRGDLSMQHYLRGLELAVGQKFAEAVDEFRESLRFKGDSGHATAAKIQMANSLRLQGKPREAIAVLQRLMEEHLDRDLSDDALWYLALAHQNAHQKDEALSVLRSLMRQFPDSQYLRQARVKSQDIKIHLYSSGK
jgi:TolA-binding protein